MRGVNAPGRSKDIKSDFHRPHQISEPKNSTWIQNSGLQIHDDSDRGLVSSIVLPNYNSNTGKENAGSSLAPHTSEKQMHSSTENGSTPNSASSSPSLVRCASTVRPPKLSTATRKVAVVSTSFRSKPRIGVRRL